MYNQPPPRGTDEWFRWVEKSIQRQAEDIQRLWVAHPRERGQIGKAAGKSTQTISTGSSA